MSNKKISKKELILANLFNSLPTYFLHLPTTFFITAPLIKGAAVIYVGLTFGAAILRTLVIALLAHFLLPIPVEKARAQQEQKRTTMKQAMSNTWKRFTKRIRKIARFTVPIYILFYFLNKFGLFDYLEHFIATYFTWLSWLSPKAISIVVLHVAAEFSAGLAAAGAMLADGSMSTREVILALLVGNILSSPVRAVRHQFPLLCRYIQTRPGFPAYPVQSILPNTEHRGHGIDVFHHHPVAFQTKSIYNTLYSQMVASPIVSSDTGAFHEKIDPGCNRRICLQFQQS